MAPTLLSTLLLNAAYTLFALFVAGFVVDIMPPALLDSGWIVTSVTSLVNLVVFPLLGLVLVHLAAYFSPTPRFQSIQLRLSNLAALVAIGFFLLLPLMGVLVVKNGQTIASNNTRATMQIKDKSNQLRMAVLNARNASELQSAMRSLQGPALDANALAIPLPALKEQLKVVIERTEQLYLDQIQGPYSPQNLPVLKVLLRTSVQCLIAGIGFAGLAWSSATQKVMLASLSTRLSSLGPKSRLGGVAKSLETFKQFLKTRSNQAVAREGWKKMKDNQRRIFLEGEKAKKRNEAEMRKQRERMKRQAEQRDKRKDWGR